MTTQSKITTAARRIAEKHNDYVRKGMAGNGKLVFGADGTGGAWYADSSYGFGGSLIVVSVRHSTMTAAEAQEMLCGIEAARAEAKERIEERLHEMDVFTR